MVSHCAFDWEQSIKCHLCTSIDFRSEIEGVSGTKTRAEALLEDFSAVTITEYQSEMIWFTPVNLIMS